MNLNGSQSKLKRRFYFHQHHWISLAMFCVVFIILIVLVAVGANWVGIPGDAHYRAFITPTLAHILTLFIIVPFFMKLPNGRTTFRKYLDNIRLTHFRPFIPLVLLGFSCSLIMLLLLSANSFIYRLMEDMPLGLRFVQSAIKIKAVLRPGTRVWIDSFPSIFEEVFWRGVFLVLFMRKYTAKKSIFITALGFGLLHLINLLFGVEFTFVLKQVLMGCIMGIFYGYLVLKSNSLMPAMIFHYLVNVFIYSFTYYFSTHAPTGTYFLYMLICLPVTATLLILWVKYFCTRWIAGSQNIKIC